jgi:hypothetical protein
MNPVLGIFQCGLYYLAQLYILYTYTFFKKVFTYEGRYVKSLKLVVCPFKGSRA